MCRVLYLEVVDSEFIRQHVDQFKVHAPQPLHCFFLSHLFFEMQIFISAIDKII